MKIETEQQACELVTKAYDECNMTKFRTLAKQTIKTRKELGGFPGCNCMNCSIVRSDLDSQTKSLLVGAYNFGRAHAINDLLLCLEKLNLFPTKTTDADLGGLLAIAEADCAASSILFEQEINNFDEETKKVFTRQHKDNSIDQS